MDTLQKLQFIFEKRLHAETGPTGGGGAGFYIILTDDEAANEVWAKEGDDYAMLIDEAVEVAKGHTDKPEFNLYIHSIIQDEQENES